MFIKNMKFVKMGIIVSILAVLSIISVNCSRESKTLAEIGNEKITLGEFEKQYIKTTGSLDSARIKPIEDKRKFLDLYINFRLKVKDARERGLLNNPDIQKDVEEYKRNYAPTYLIDKEIVEEQVRKLYERKKDEIRASHILINLIEKPTPEDSIAAYQKADSIIQKLKDGEDFGELALKYSNDRSVNMNRGDLYYFTAGMTVPEFEDAVYDMKVGEFSKKPIRTLYGLHIVKVTDRKPRIESIRVSHILIADKRDSLGNLIDSIETYNKALEVFKRANSGESFEALAEQLSEDVGTKSRGGDLGFLQRRQLAQPIDSAAFSMKLGEIIGPIKTPYGWHIIKKTDEKKYGSFEEEFEKIKNEYKKTKNYKDDYTKYVENLMAKFSFKILPEGLDFLKSKFDSLKTIADYNLDSLFNNQDKEFIIATFDGGSVKVIDIINHLNINRDFSRMTLLEQTLRMIISSSAENPVLNKMAQNKGIEKDDEFIANITDYENGLLVFKIDQEELWSKVKVTEQDIVSYYNNNKSKFTKIDSTGATVSEPLEEARPKVSNEIQQEKYKETERVYLESLRQKYPVKIYDAVLEESFKD
jgi:peptidyl-prolyl cis-trans isomerase SurA